MSEIEHEEPFDIQAFAAALAPAEGRSLFECDLPPMWAVGIEIEHEAPAEPLVRFRGVRFGPLGQEAEGDTTYSEWSGWFPVADAPIHLEIDLFDWGEE